LHAGSLRSPPRKVPIGEGFECPKNARFQHGHYHHIHFNDTFQHEKVILALKVENWIPGGVPPQKKRCPDFDEKNLVLHIFLSKYLSKMKANKKSFEKSIFWKPY